MEVEAKFRVPDEATLARLEAVPALAGYDVDAGERRHDSDTFLDTLGPRLPRAPATTCAAARPPTACASRSSSSPSDDGGVLRREELEMLVAADVPVDEWPAGDLRDARRGARRRDSRSSLC